MYPTSRPRLAFALLALAFVATAGRASADVAFDVSLDTSPLAANPGEGPYALDFTLIGVEGNTVTISDIRLGAGGSAGGTINRVNGATGDLSSGVVLDDSADFFNDFNQTFTPGDVLSFHVVATTSFPGPTPDNFSFSILTGDGLSFPTTDSVASTLMNVDLIGTSPTFNTFAADTSQSFSDGSPVFPMTAPVVTVPEPSSITLCGLGIAGAAVRFRRRSPWT